MADRPRIDLFCEDRAHEQFVRALVARLAGEEGLKPTVRAMSARGGHPRALAEFRLWQRAFLNQARRGLPDLLVLVIDANCQGWSTAHGQIQGAIDQAVVPNHVVGCPDPHIERWYIADPAAFEAVVGVQPGRDREKCERDVYKRLVEQAVDSAGLPLLTGTADLAPDLVAAMDLYKAGRAQRSLRLFVKGLRAELRRLAR